MNIGLLSTHCFEYILPVLNWPFTIVKISPSLVDCSHMEHWTMTSRWGCNHGNKLINWDQQTSQCQNTAEADRLIAVTAGFVSKDLVFSEPWGPLSLTHSISNWPLSYLPTAWTLDLVYVLSTPSLCGMLGFCVVSLSALTFLSRTRGVLKKKKDCYFLSTLIPKC